MKALLKSAVKRVASPLIDATGLYDRRLTRLVDAPGRLLVVMYHRVIDNPGAKPSPDPFSLGMCVRQKHFEAQMDFMKSRFNVMPLAQALRAVRNGQTLPPATAAITFDDGYLDCLTHAAPVLKALELPATFFVPTGGLEQGHAFWWDRAIAAVADTTLSSVELPELQLSGSLSLRYLNRRASLVRILDALWSQPVSALPTAVDALVAKLVPAQSYLLSTDARAARMSPAQVRELAGMGFAIGGHTVNHVDLRHLDAEAVRQELTISHEALEALLEQAVTTFAYPSGFHNDDLQRAVRNAGFEGAVSTDKGINTTGFNTHAVYRIGMPDTGVADFKRALSCAPLAGDVPLFSGRDAPVLTSLVR